MERPILIQRDFFKPEGARLEGAFILNSDSSSAVLLVKVEPLRGCNYENNPCHL
jgi:hypothetical protein